MVSQFPINYETQKVYISQMPNNSEYDHARDKSDCVFYAKNRELRSNKVDKLRHLLANHALVHTTTATATVNQHGINGVILPKDVHNTMAVI